MASATAKSPAADKAKSDTPEISQGTKNLAEVFRHDIKDKFSAEKKTHTAEKKLFERVLPEDVTPEMMRSVFDALGEIYPAAQLALGEEAVKVMKKNSEVNQLVYSIPLTGRDRIDVTFDRSRTVPQRQEDGTMAPGKMFGYSRVELNTFGTRNRGQITAVKEHLSALANKALNT